MVDTMMAVALLAVLALVAIPAVGPDQPLRVISAATVLASDIEFAQSASLASPSDPVVVRFDPDGGRYWLARASSPDAPIDRPGRHPVAPYVVEFGAADALYLAGVGATTQNIPDGVLAFDAFGRLDQMGDARVTLANTSGSATVQISASTGSVALVP
ncbi:MAG TPA: hypothetical protein DEB06_05930 [Phycisphaerales bacterium]|nr:hypothetical protein [Phycisphaerales bacterium]